KERRASLMARRPAWNALRTHIQTVLRDIHEKERGQDFVGVFGHPARGLAPTDAARDEPGAEPPAGPRGPGPSERAPAAAPSRERRSCKTELVSRPPPARPPLAQRP